MSGVIPIVWEGGGYGSVSCDILGVGDCLGLRKRELEPHKGGF